MNRLYPEQLSLYPDSSQEYTNEVCILYYVKELLLNAAIFEKLLQETTVEIQLQASLVRGWNEGLDLESDLPNGNEFVVSPLLNQEKMTIFNESVVNDIKKYRPQGPYTKPVRDSNWFKQAWVLSYFVFPKSKLQWLRWSGN